MPEDELASLPAASPLRRLCPITIDLAKRLDPVIEHASGEQAFCNLHIEMQQGLPRTLQVQRSFKVNGAEDLMARMKEILDFLESEQGYAELRIEVKRGEAKMLHVQRSFRLDDA